MLKTPQGESLYCLLESSHFILCVCLDETPLEPIWTFELWGSGHFECFLFGTAVWLAETVIKIFGCQSKRNGLALWWAIIRKRSWREKKLWMLKSDEKIFLGYLLCLFVSRVGSFAFAWSTCRNFCAALKIQFFRGKKYLKEKILKRY